MGEQVIVCIRSPPLPAEIRLKLVESEKYKKIV
jgi:hypothetical protein